MEPVIVIGSILLAVLLLFMSGVQANPFKWLGLIGVKFVAGALFFLFCLNLFGESLGLHVSINPVTSGISGLLGIPGVAALIVIEKFII
ncbi:sigma-K factor-processing regulatory protein BofA [Bacillus safensis]|uniref:Sigma-K factor-processing regulatory protein BofA n=1 Tax=Bacillus safensis TaxID=561879 RepID=A0A5S9M3I3_BACIA|nr:sigma-K factor-processing regulatory protein BofA [Bacillus safensis]